MESAFGGGEPAIKQGINGTNGLITWRRVNGSQQVNFTAYEGSQLKTASDAAGHNLFTHTFNSTTGNTTSTSRAGNVVVGYGYDTYGRRTSVTPAEGATATTFYDAINRTDSMKVGGSKPSKITYGAHYTEVRDPANQLYRTEVNGLGWVTKLIDPTSEADEFKYNKDGERREWKNREAQTITETPDVANERWVSSVVPDTVTVDRTSIGGGDSLVVVTAANQYARETTYLNARGLPTSVETYYPAISKTFSTQY